jgi:phosphosulfolactate phosphohydrolase-like enzyme
VKQLAKLILRLKEFRLSNVKASSQTIKALLEIIEESSSIKKLRLSQLEIKSDILICAQLNKICLNGHQFLELDLSGLSLMPN